MKRRTGSFIVVVALIFAIGLSACGSSGSDSETKSLYSEGLEIVQIMSEMVQSESYINLYTGDSSVQSIVQSLANGDYSSPKAVYAISVPEKSLEVMAELDTLDNASENLRSFALKRVFGALMTRVNAMSGVENLAAASICTVSKTFVDENVDGDIIYLYTYDNAVPIAVTFMVGDNKSVSANGVFVMDDELSLDSAEEIETLFDGFTVEVTEIKPEK